jgi:hypothetical protein
MCGRIRGAFGVCAARRIAVQASVARILPSSLARALARRSIAIFETLRSSITARKQAARGERKNDSRFTNISEHGELFVLRIRLRRIGIGLRALSDVRRTSTLTARSVGVSRLNLPTATGQSKGHGNHREQ